MKFTIAWEADVEHIAGQAVRHDHADVIRKLAHDLEAGNRIWESWLLTTGGVLIAYSGNQGQAEVPGDRLGELQDLRRQYAECCGAPASVGVGVELHEAVLALQVAQRRGDDKVVLYTPDIAKELEDSSHDEDEAALLGDIDKAEPQEAQPPMRQQGSPSPGEATKITRGDIDPQAAQPSAPSPVTPGSPAAPAGQPGQAQNPDQLKAAVVRVLQQAKQLAPQLESIKQESPELYEVVNGTVQAMIEMAKQLFGQPQGQPVAKKESKVEIRPEDSEESSALEKKHLTMHHHLNLPPGSIQDGRVRIVHSDGSTGWVSVRAGQVMSNDPVMGGHPISVRDPNGR